MDIFAAGRRSRTGICTVDGGGHDWKHYLSFLSREMDFLKKIGQLEIGKYLAECGRNGGEEPRDFPRAVHSAVAVK